MAASHIVISVVFFREAGGAWVAQGLEHDIAAHGATVPEARVAFERTVGGYLRLDARMGRDPLSTLEPAPTMYWDVWNRVATKALEQPSLVANDDAESVPPAYVIAAISTEPPIALDH